MSENFSVLPHKIQTLLGLSEEDLALLHEELDERPDLICQTILRLIAKMDGAELVHQDLKVRLANFSSIAEIQAHLTEKNLTSNPSQSVEHLKKLRATLSKMRDLIVHSENLGTLTLEKETFNLQSLFRHIINTVKLLELRKNNNDTLIKALEFNIPDIEYKGDFVKLTEAFFNLLYFLLKIENEGKVVMNVIQNETDVTIHIDHIGCGVDEEEAKMLFELHSQSPTATNHEGTGLLLVASHNTIIHHSGTLDFHNYSDRCGFDISLPLS